MTRRPSLNALKAFAVAAQTGSFTLAGEVLHVTQGAISRQVKQLEENLGTALFVRAHHKVVLTPAGQTLAQTLYRLFDEMDRAVEKAAAAPQRHMLRLNVPPTFATRWLAPRLSDFRAQFAHIDLSITTERIQSLREAQGLDCWIVFDVEAWPQVPCQPLMQERHIMVSSPALWQQGQPKPLAYATLLHILDGDRRIPVWERWIAQHGPQGLDAQPGLNFSTLDQAINAAMVGAGVVIVDQAMIVPELRSGALLAHSPQQMHGPHGYWFVEPPVPTVMHEQVALFKQWLLLHVEQARSHGV